MFEYKYQTTYYTGGFQINCFVGARVNEWMIQCMAMKSTKVRSSHSTCGVTHSVKISSDCRVSESKWFVGDHFDPVLTSFKYDFQKAFGDKVLPS